MGEFQRGPHFKAINASFLENATACGENEKPSNFPLYISKNTSFLLVMLEVGKYNLTYPHLVHKL